MLRFFKQKLDKMAIEAAAKALPCGTFNEARAAKAAELLANPQLLQPVEATPALNENADGFSFPSNITTPCIRNNTVHGHIFRVGQDWRSRPLVILVHGWNAELHYLHVLPRVARTLTARGINAAVIELPYHLRRRPSRESAGVHDFISDDLPAMLLATRQAVSDLHALTRWAKTEGCPGVSLWGFSLGAWLVGHYICHSNLPAQAILTTPVMNLSRAVEELAFCHPIRSAIPKEKLDLTALNLTDRKPQIDPRSIFVTQSLYDLFVPPETYVDLSAAWNLPGWEKFPQSHISVLFSPKSTRAIVDWIALQFKQSIPLR